MELELPNLPRDEFPNLVAAANHLADVDRERWWRDNRELVLAGPQGMVMGRLEGPARGAASPTRHPTRAVNAPRARRA